MSSSSHGPSWPDPLMAPEREFVNELLGAFWRQIRNLSAILNDEKPRRSDSIDAAIAEENLLAIECIAGLRAIVIDMMLALNGITRPVKTVNLNAYLSANQRTALERTMLAPEIGAATWIGQAVSLVVVYRWYAPQLVERYDLEYPSDLEAEVWASLRRKVYDWPADISTDAV